jgi:predicted metal-dependent HD superfamily phosphohydrolase
MDFDIELKNIESYVTRLFIENDSPNLYYHNVMRTREVVAITKEIAGYYELDQHDLFLLCAAAWFHDIGFLVDRNNHEAKSAELAVQYLKTTSLAAPEIETIEKCILASKMPQNPVSLLEQILCDASLYYMGTDQYKQISKIQKKEAQALNSNVSINESIWRKEKIQLFESHQFHTTYCQSRLQSKKDENLAKLKNKQMDAAPNQVNGAEQENGVAEKNKNNGSGKKDNRPERGVETMFKISATNSVRISMMADNKAHIMISVNSILISVVLVFLIKNIEEYIELLIPTIMMLLVNIGTITFAVLATRPRITNGLFTQKQVEEKSVNLLYFGSFYNMNYPEYHEAVDKMMNDGEFLYGSLSKDLFWQGKTLGRKYRLLSITYNIFMYGMIATVAAFTIALIIHFQAL